MQSAGNPGTAHKLYLSHGPTPFPDPPFILLFLFYYFYFILSYSIPAMHAQFYILHAYMPHAGYSYILQCITLHLMNGFSCMRPPSPIFFRFTATRRENCIIIIVFSVVLRFFQVFHPFMIIGRPFCNPA